MMQCKRNGKFCKTAQEQIAVALSVEPETNFRFERSALPSIAVHGLSMAADNWGRWTRRTS
jgi:hypothetical protein